MRQVIVLFPLIGIAAAVAVPLIRHVERLDHEEVAVDVVHAVQAAEEQFRIAAGGYATDIARLASGCRGKTQALDRDLLTRLARAGYALQLHAAAGSAIVEADACDRQPVASDYYVAAAPVASTEAASQAFAGRAKSGVYLFYDGIAPREVDIESGLATPLAQRATFKIP